MAGEHEVDLTRAGIPDSAEVILLSVTLPGNVRLQDLRLAKEVIIPDGVRRIGNNWFWGSRVERVEIPASVEEIGEKAFYDNTLKEITITSGSRLKTVGDYTFGANQLDRESVCFPEGAQVSEKVFEISLCRK